MKKRKGLIMSLCLLLFCTICLEQTKVQAMKDGAYVVKVSYSYKNPDSNETEDGSANVALGESMIASMLEETALVEQVQGKTYVTIGLGMMSNVSKVRILTQNVKGGTYKQVTTKKTGTSKKNGDTCNHYRFEVKTTNAYISPVLFVDPMGREVQFFVWINMSTAKKGTGIYKSEMIPVATKEPVATKKPVATKEPVATKKPVATKEPEATKEPVGIKVQEEQNTRMVCILVGITFVSVIGTIIMIRKLKSEKNEEK